MKVHLTQTIPLISDSGLDTGNKLTYPLFAFAFNPITLRVETVQDGSVMIKVGNIEIVRETKNNEAYFDLSAVARSMFDRSEFHKSLNWDVIPLVEDKNLFKTLVFDIIMKGSSISQRCSIPVVWGAMQIGETYTARRNLKMFKGYPFAVPFFFMEKNGGNDTLISVRVDNEEWSNKVSISEGKHYLMTGSVFVPQKRLTIWVDNSENDALLSTFDYSFDYTFQALTANSFLINVDVLDTCGDKGYYLRWINSHGEYCYWFFKPQIESTKIENKSVEFDQYYTTVDYTENYHVGTGKSVGKTVEKTVQLYADFVDSTDFDFLMGVVQSPVVDLYMGRTSGADKWMSVNIQPATFPKGKEHLQDFSFILEFPRTQIQSL